MHKKTFWWVSHFREKNMRWPPFALNLCMLLIAIAPVIHVFINYMYTTEYRVPREDVSTGRFLVNELVNRGDISRDHGGGHWSSQSVAIGRLRGESKIKTSQPPQSNEMFAILRKCSYLPPQFPFGSFGVQFKKMARFHCWHVDNIIRCCKQNVSWQPG